VILVGALLVLVVIGVVLSSLHNRYFGKRYVANAHGRLWLPHNIEQFGDRWVESSDTAIMPAWVYSYRLRSGLDRAAVSARPVTIRSVCGSGLCRL
jgi:hypothetical protein